MELTDYLVITMFASFICFLLLGVPVAYCLWGTAMVFTLVGWGADAYLETNTGLGYNFLGMAVRRIYNVMTNWVLVALPMFIFMGLMLERSGVAERLMRSAQDLFGRVRGGLAVTTAMIGVLLAALHRHSGGLGGAVGHAQPAHHAGAGLLQGAGTGNHRRRRHPGHPHPAQHHAGGHGRPVGFERGATSSWAPSFRAWPWPRFTSYTS